MFPIVSTKTTVSDRNRNQYGQVELIPVKCCDSTEQLWRQKNRTGTPLNNNNNNNNSPSCCCIGARNFSLGFSLTKVTVIMELTQYTQCEYKHSKCWLPELGFQQSSNSEQCCNLTAFELKSIWLSWCYCFMQ